MTTGESCATFPRRLIHSASPTQSTKRREITFHFLFDPRQSPKYRLLTSREVSEEFQKIPKATTTTTLIARKFRAV